MTAECSCTLQLQHISEGGPLWRVGTPKLAHTARRLTQTLAVTNVGIGWSSSLATIYASSVPHRPIMNLRMDSCTVLIPPPSPRPQRFPRSPHVCTSGSLHGHLGDRSRAPVQYIRTRRPASLDAAASSQARRSLKHRMPGSSVGTPFCTQVHRRLAGSSTCHYGLIISHATCV